MNNYQKRFRGIAIAVALLFAATAGADQASTWTPNKSNPYRGLFNPQATAPAAPAKAAPQAEPVVKCGLTMIPGDPKIDPGIAKKPQTPSTRFPMKAIEPPICR